MELSAPAPVKPNDKGVLESVRSPLFWCLWLGFGACVGGAITCSNNLALLSRARETCDYEALASASLTLLTGFDALGRIIGGFAITRLRFDPRGTQLFQQHLTLRGT